jgi:glyoxylase-like metal-dependent hydrolase (beta-lactamase superfamily II)
MSQVAPRYGIHQVPGTGFSNAYLVEVDQQGLVLIDTGTRSGYSKVLAYLAGIGRKPSDVNYIILTHADGDHSGSAAKLKRVTGASLAIHELDAPRISGEKRLKEASGFGGFMVSVLGVFMRVERVKPDIVLKEGATVGPLAILHTPGHTDGSISIYKPNEGIFVGDLLRTDAAGNLKLASPSMSRNMAQVRSSVERISKMEFSMLLPGHGKPLEEDAAKRLREFVAKDFRSP